MNKLDSKLDENLQKAYESFNLLPDIYKKNIGLINALKLRSKSFMDTISNIEGGSSLGDQDPNSNFSLLLLNIKEFNENINSQSIVFSKIFHESIQYFESAIIAYREEESGLTKILEARKKLLFTAVILNKLQHKVSSLQHMNSILFSISTSLKNSETDYKEELKELHTTIVRAEDKSRWLVREIENLM